MRHSLSAGLVLGILAFPAFLVYGYKPVTIAGASLPLSVILSGLVMITWYTFAWGYFNARNLLQGELSQPWFDGALILLVASSLGAWGVAVVQAVDPSNQLFMKGLTHFFLATFTEGWVVLSVLAIAITELPLKSRDWLLSADFSLGCIAIGAPLTFALGISETMLSPVLLIGARAGSFLAALGLLITLFAFFRSGTWKMKLWGWAMGMLALKGLLQLSASVYPSLFWLSDHGLRILYLHLLLLGGFTLALIGWWHNRTNLPDVYFSITAGSVLSVLISLILPTSFWPTLWSGFWIFYALIIAALLPPLAVLLEWMSIPRSERYPTD
ncbi:MAG: hypothetical protein U5K69_00110 [Balneolaceae bacterium]|nr:hypothetical protein [Balneolaceae bacterium]